MNEIITSNRKQLPKSGRITLIDVEMLYDWIKYREALDMNVTVPPFRREEYQ